MARGRKVPRRYVGMMTLTSGGVSSVLAMNAQQYGEGNGLPHQSYARGTTDGIRYAHGRTASNAAPARSTGVSPPRRPTIGRPMGRPSKVNPAGTDMAGSP